MENTSAEEPESTFSLESMDTTSCPEEESKPVLIGVHVSGAVLEPDRVYYLAYGARVEDAIEAAGGALEEADLSALNLADYLRDGEKINVPKKGEEVESTITLLTGAEEDESEVSLLTNINSASKIELMELPGIGEKLANRIIAYREENGPFKAIGDIMNVSGISESIF